MILMEYISSSSHFTSAEKGNFFALDLGGSNFRVLLVELDAGKVTMKNKVYNVAKELMVGTGEQVSELIIRKYC